MKNKFDAIIIGAGQAGPALAREMTNKGKKVAMIERKLFGGTCVNTGCIPSKILVASAHVAHLVTKANEFGIEAQLKNVNMKKIKERKDNIIHKLSASIEKSLTELPHCTVYKGHAQFENANTIRINHELITAEKIFINVGARAFIPKIPGLEKINYLTNSTIMDMDTIPKHLIIIGGSYIGLEFAQIYRRFGAKVTIIEKGERLIEKEDPDISAAIKEILMNEEIDVKLNSECIAVDKHNNEIVIKLKCDDSKKEIIASHLLLAVGRKPNTEDLGLENAGIEIDERGYIQVNDQLQTNVSNIWALGECNGKGAFTHTSYNDYEIVAAYLLNHGKRKVTDRILTYGLFVDPPLGRAGMTETEARHLGKKILVAKKPMREIKRAVIKNNPQGFMKIIIDKETNQILGAATLGEGGDEIIHSILDVMYAKAPYTVIQHAVHIHPTVSEYIPTMLGTV